MGRSKANCTTGHAVGSVRSCVSCLWLYAERRPRLRLHRREGTSQKGMHMNESWRTADTLSLDMLDQIELAVGSHRGRTNGLCAMEIVAWLAGEPHSDHPQCVSPVIGAFMRSWNDSLHDTDRTRLLRPLLPDILNTATTDEDEQRRAMMAVDWMVRSFTPLWLDAAKLTEEASTLRALPELRDMNDILRAQPTIDRAKERASAAWCAAWDAAWDAARAAAWGAAWDAAGDAARGAALYAAGDAARDAAWAAARNVLRPVVESCQASAVDLVRRMAAVGRDGKALGRV